MGNLNELTNDELLTLYKKNQEIIKQLKSEKESLEMQGDENA